MSSKISSLTEVLAANVLDTDIMALSRPGVITNKIKVSELRLKLGTNPPAGGRTVTDTATYLSNNAKYNVKDFGAFGDNVTDDTAAVQLAASKAALAGGVLFFPAGFSFKTNATLVINSPVEGKDSNIYYTGAGIAVQLGDGTNIIQNFRIVLPTIYQAAKTGLGWGTFAGTNVGTSIGVKVVHGYNLDLVVQQVRNFGVGLLFFGNADGDDYSVIHIGVLSNNKVNLKFDGDATGWTNELVFIGGHLRYDGGEGTAVVGTRQILITKPAGQIINNHRFYGLSLEGDVAEYIVESHGSYCYFDRCRWEATTPRVLLDGSSVAGAGYANTFAGGYNLRNVVFTHANGAAATRVESDQMFSWAPAPGDAIFKLSNGNSSATAVMKIYQAGADPLTALASDWSFMLSSQALKGKLPGDTEAASKIEMNFTTGDVTLRGGGSLKPTAGKAIDVSGMNTSIPNTTTATLVAGVANMLLVIQDTDTGATAMILGSTIISDPSAAYSNTSGTAGKYNVFFAGGNLQLQNNRGAGTGHFNYTIIKIS